MRGQIALEFSFVVGFSILFFLVALVALAVNMEQARAERGAVALQGMARAIQRELLLAAVVEDGYERRFTIPQRVDGNLFFVANDASTVTLSLADGQSYTELVPEVTGSLAVGENRVRKVGGQILVDQS